MTNKLKTCPHCAELVEPEAILCRFCDRGIATSHFKNCPFCSEPVWTGATFCRYCRTALGSEMNVLKPHSRDRQVDPWQQPIDDEWIDKIFTDRSENLKREK